jgi:phenylacetate-CoA ligase
MLREIQGRTTDFVVTADGTIMHGLALIYILRDLPGVEAFKVIQDSVESTRVQLVAGPNLPADAHRTITEGFKRRLGANVMVTIEPVDHIPPERSGKFRYIVSHVAKS